MLSVAALLLHAAALGGLEWSWPSHDAEDPPAAVRLRLVEGLPAGVAAGVAPLPLPNEAEHTPALTAVGAAEVAQVPPVGSADVGHREPQVAAPATPPARPHRRDAAVGSTALAPPSARLPSERSGDTATAASEPAVVEGPPSSSATDATGLAPAAPSDLASGEGDAASRGVVVMARAAAVTEAASAPAAVSGTSATAGVSAGSAAAVASVTDGDAAMPRYRTRMPPAFTVRYELQRGSLRGSGELAWRPDGERYELKLSGRVAGLPVITQTSTGGFDGAGIAPARFTDQRLSRGTQAANFQRSVGKITFSGPTTEYPLRDGAQDRLSWMVQLAAIVSADPRLRTPGARVVMYVVGARAEADVWAFICSGPEAVDTGAGSAASIKFAREPREPNDTHIEVWLDPKQHDLPVRATQRSGDGAEVFELRLQSIAWPS